MEWLAQILGGQKGRVPNLLNQKPANTGLENLNPPDSFDRVAISYGVSRGRERFLPSLRAVTPGVVIDLKKFFPAEKSSSEVEVGDRAVACSSVYEILICLENGNTLSLSRRYEDGNGGLGVISWREAKGSIVSLMDQNDCLITIGQPLSTQFGVDAGAKVKSAYIVIKGYNDPLSECDSLGILRASMFLNPGAIFSKEKIGSAAGNVLYVKSQTNKLYKLTPCEDGSILVTEAQALSRQRPAHSYLVQPAFHLGQSLQLAENPGGEVTKWTSSLHEVGYKIGGEQNDTFELLKRQFQAYSDPSAEDKTEKY